MMYGSCSSVLDVWRMFHSFLKFGMYIINSETVNAALNVYWIAFLLHYMLWKANVYINYFA